MDQDILPTFPGSLISSSKSSTLAIVRQMTFLNMFQVTLFSSRPVSTWLHVSWYYSNMRQIPEQQIQQELVEAISTTTPAQEAEALKDRQIAQLREE